MTVEQQNQLNVLMRAIHIARTAQAYFDGFIVPNRDSFDLSQQLMLVNDLAKDSERAYHYAKQFMPLLLIIDAMTLQEIAAETAVYFLPEYNPPATIEELRALYDR